MIRNEIDPGWSGKGLQMKKGSFGKVAGSGIFLALLCAGVARADRIAFHPYPGLLGAGSGFDFTWHATATPVVDRSLHSADAFGRALEEWNRQGRSSYHGPYPVGYPGPEAGGDESGPDAFGADWPGGIGQGGRGESVPSAPAVPEPTTALLFAGGLLGIVALARRRA